MNVITEFLLVAVGSLIVLALLGVPRHEAPGLILIGVGVVALFEFISS